MKRIALTLFLFTFAHVRAGGPGRWSLTPACERASLGSDILGPAKARAPYFAKTRDLTSFPWFSSHVSSAREWRSLAPLIDQSLRRAGYLGSGDGHYRVLDLACGYAVISVALAAVLGDGVRDEVGKNITYVGIDNNPITIGRLSQLLQILPFETEAIYGDARALSQRPTANKDLFDIVVLRNQNFYLSPSGWAQLTREGLLRLQEDGLVIMTSYTADEHRFAASFLKMMGVEILLDFENREGQMTEILEKLTQVVMTVQMDRHVLIGRKR